VEAGGVELSGQLPDEEGLFLLAAARGEAREKVFEIISALSPHERTLFRSLLIRPTIRVPFMEGSADCDPPDCSGADCEPGDCSGADCEPGDCSREGRTKLPSTRSSSVLFRCSRRAQVGWDCLNPLLDLWIPQPRVLHRYADNRLRRLSSSVRAVRITCASDLCGGRAVMVVPTATVDEFFPRSIALTGLLALLLSAGEHSHRHFTFLQV
jgi:hypothetical protein